MVFANGPISYRGKYVPRKRVKKSNFPREKSMARRHERL
jgi:hypothetical protein